MNLVFVTMPRPLALSQDFSFHQATSSEMMSPTVLAARRLSGSLWVRTRTLIGQGSGHVAGSLGRSQWVFLSPRVRPALRICFSEIWMSEKQIRRAGLTRGDKNTHWLLPRDPATCPDPCPIKVRVRTQSDPESLRAANTVGLIISDEVAWWKEKSWLNANGRGIVTKTKFIGGTTP